MSEYNFDDKPKNDGYFDNYGKNKNDYQYSEPERGGCLSVFLGFLGLANVGILLFTFSTFSEFQSYPSYYQNDLSLAYTLLCLQVFISLGVFACIYGVWNWKSWGYHGMLLIYGINIVVGFLAGGAAGFGGLVGLGIFYYLMKDKTQYLD